MADINANIDTSSEVHTYADFKGQKDTVGADLVQITVTPNSAAIHSPQFDVTGKRLPDKVIQFFPEQIQAQIDALQKLIDNKKVLLSDYNAAKAKLTPSASVDSVKPV